MRFAAALLAALVLAIPAQAQFGGGGQKAKRVAIERFPEIRCHPYSIGYRDLPGSILGYVYGGTCRIWFDHSLSEFPFRERCTLETHERGHLAGYPDQRRPHIMRRNPPLHKPCLQRRTAHASSSGCGPDLITQLPMLCERVVKLPSRALYPVRSEDADVSVSADRKALHPSGSWGCEEWLASRGIVALVSRCGPLIGVALFPTGPKAPERARVVVGGAAP